MSNFRGKNSNGIKFRIYISWNCCISFVFRVFYFDILSFLLTFLYLFIFIGGVMVQRQLNIIKWTQIFLYTYSSKLIIYFLVSVWMWYRLQEKNLVSIDIDSFFFCFTGHCYMYITALDFSTQAPCFLPCTPWFVANIFLLFILPFFIRLENWSTTATQF